MTEEKKTVLVVDDDPDTVEYISTVLEDAGFATRTAENGQQAEESIEASLPDLITLDVSMPEKSGIRFYRDMKENDQRKHIPLIMITGADANLEKFLAGRKQTPPPNAFMPKPIDRAKLLELAQQLTA